MMADWRQAAEILGVVPGSLALAIAGIAAESGLARKADERL